MKRHPALQPLSRDHHDFLLHARRLRGLDARVEVHEAVADFARALPRLEEHFAQEETQLGPLLGSSPHAARLRQEHRNLLADAVSLTTEGADAFGQRLRDHVRWEEEELFAWLQSSGVELDALQLGSASQCGLPRRAEV